MKMNYKEVDSLLTEQKQQPEAGKITKKIGDTTYEVHINFSKTSHEDMNDKILRLIKNDAKLTNLK